MSFEDGKNIITAPIDPGEGYRYVEPVRYERELDNIYNVTSNKANYVDPDADGKLSWKSSSSWDDDSEQTLEDWQNRLHEVSTRCCSYVTKSLRWIESEVCNYPVFDGTSDLEIFRHTYQMTVPEKDWLRALDVAFKAMPARWWVTHKEHIENWSQLKRLMTIWFFIVYKGTKYTSKTSPREHIDICIQTWQAVPQIEWVHMFVSTLDTVPRNWYIELELRQGTRTWGEMVKDFIGTFSFEDDNPTIDSALQVVKERIWDEEEIVTERTESVWDEKMDYALACYNVAVDIGDPESEEEDPRHLDIVETEGE